MMSIRQYLVIAPVIITGGLLVLPSRTPEVVSWGSSILSPARQMVYALNFPVLPVIALVQYFGSFGLMPTRKAVSDIVLFFGVCGFWLLLIPFVHGLPNGSKLANSGRFIILIVLLANALYFVLAGASAHYPVLWLAGWIWFVAIATYAALKVAAIVRRN